MLGKNLQFLVNNPALLIYQPVYIYSVCHVMRYFCVLLLDRFPEVAELVNVCWLEINGVINTIVLSPNTQYAAYVVFKMIDASGFLNHSADLSVGVEGGQSSTKTVCLVPNVEGWQQLHNRLVELQRPSVRSDGWLEIEMGEFFNSGIENDKVQMNLIQTRGGNWKRGLFLEGIEVRPKYNN